MSTPGRAGGLNAEQQQSIDTIGGGVQQGTILTRTLYVNISGTLANLAMAGPSGGTWKLVDGKQIGVFGVGTEVDSQVCHPNAPRPTPDRGWADTVAAC